MESNPKGIVALSDLTGIIGLANSGKTILAKSLNKSVNTIYYTDEKHKQLKDNFIYVQVDVKTKDELLNFIISDFSNYNGITNIIIDVELSQSHVDYMDEKTFVQNLRSFLIKKNISCTLVVSKRVQEHTEKVWQLEDIQSVALAQAADSIFAIRKTIDKPKTGFWRTIINFFLTIFNKPVPVKINLPYHQLSILKNRYGHQGMKPIKLNLKEGTFECI